LYDLFTLHVVIQYVRPFMHSAVKYVVRRRLSVYSLPRIDKELL